MRGSAVALTVAVAALLTVTACTSPASTAVAPQNTGPSTTPSDPAAGSAQAAGPIVPTDSTLRWHSCAGLIAQMGIRDCTMLSVPLNYADPSGRHISLALDMVPATAPVSQQQGILLVNPGGRAAADCPWPPKWPKGSAPAWRGTTTSSASTRAASGRRCPS